jgi:hypothetical protein
MSGGLQSITNTPTAHTQPATGRGYVEIPAKQANTDAIAEAPEDSIDTKVANPEMPTIKVEPASGKENVSSTA